MAGAGTGGAGVGAVPGLGYQPTHVYPRIVWDGVTLDLEGRIGTRWGIDPPVGVRDVVRADRAALRIDRVAQFSARRETIFGHLEEAVTFTAQHLPGWKAKQVDQFLEAWGLPGRQFEFWLDRCQGAALEFEDTLTDQQGTAGTFAGTASFEDARYGRGLLIDSGEYLTFPTAPSGSQASLDRTKGLIILVVRPSFQGADGIERTFLDIDPVGNGRMRLYKSASNALVWSIEDSGGHSKSISIAASWATYSVQEIVVRWTEGGGLALWLNGSQASGEPGSGAGTGRLPSLPTNLVLGTDSAGTTPAPGLYDRLVILREPFWLTSSVIDVLVREWFPHGSNYFAAAELVGAQVTPTRPYQGRERWEYRLSIRKGVAA